MIGTRLSSNRLAAAHGRAAVLIQHAAVALCALWPVTQAGAQAPDLDLSFGARSISCGASAFSAGAASAAVRARWPFVGAVASGIPLTTPAAPDRSAAISAFTPAWHGLRADATLDWHAAPACGSAPAARAATGQLSWSAGPGGVWLGVETQGDVSLVERPSTDSGARNRTLRLGDAASLGTWRRFGPVRASLGLRATQGALTSSTQVTHLESRPDSVWADSTGWIRFTRQVVRPERVSATAHSALIDALGRLSFASGRLAADATFSVPVRDARFGLLPWADVQLSVAVSPYVSLLASAASSTGSSLTSDGRSRWQMSLGMRLASLPFSRPRTGAPPPERAAASAFRAVRGSDGVATISLRAPEAELVELTGDFADWSTLRMHRISADWWGVSLPLAPGIYRVNVRIDGADWVAPPGLPRQDDEFGGAVGILVVR